MSDKSSIWFRSNGPEEYRFLSNFYPCTLRLIVTGYGPVTAPSLEHAYQALKCRDRDDFFTILRLPSAADAQVAGRRVPLRDGFDPRFTMRKLINMKFRHRPISDALNELGQLLVNTGDAQLIEDNRGPWGGRDGGANWLGIMLMERRAELQ